MMSFQHESIAEFPSKFFYNDRLTVGKDDQTKASPLKFWPNDRRRPVAFVHVMGVEQMMTVITTRGIEHSQSNAKEVDATVCYIQYELILSVLFADLVPV